MAAKTIKIFLASSEELRNERLEITDLVEHLNKIFKAREIQFELVKWEHLDSSMGSTHKQDEYNEELKKCELCFVLFWKKFGCFTNIELQTAYDCLTKGQNPRKLYVLFKETETDKISKDLQEFKDGIVSNYGHFYDKFENIDAIKLFFLLRIEDYQNDNISRLTEVRNGQIYLGGEPVVNLDNISFISNNEDFLKMNDELKKLSSEIENKKNQIERKNESANEKKSKIERKNKKLADNPEDEDLIDDLKELDKDLTTLNNELKELNEDLKSLIDKKSNILGEINQHRDSLLAAAKIFAKYQGEQTNDRIMRAKEAFEAGDSRKANIILEDTEIVAYLEQGMKGYEKSKELTEQFRKTVVFSINELITKAFIVMTDLTQTIGERIEKANKNYSQAVECAQRINLEKDEFITILSLYYSFLLSFTKLEEAECVVGKLKDVLDDDTSNQGLYEYFSANLSLNKGMYDKAIEQALKALSVIPKSSDKQILEACCLQLLANSYLLNLDYDNSIEYQEKALNIYIDVFGEFSQQVRESYFNLGFSYDGIKDREKSIYFIKKSSEFEKSDYKFSEFEKSLFAPEIIKANTFVMISCACSLLENYDPALENINKAIKIYEKQKGDNNCDLANAYSQLGMIYYDMKDYNKCIEYNTVALKIYENIGIGNHTHTTVFLSNIGLAYEKMECFENSLSYFFKELSVEKNTCGNNSSRIASSYNNIARIYMNLRNYEQQLEYYLLELDVVTKLYGSDDIKTAEAYMNVAHTYYLQLRNYDKALEYFCKAENIYGRNINKYKKDEIDVCRTIASIYSTHNKTYDISLEYCLKSLKLCEELFGAINENVADVCDLIAFNYYMLENFDDSLAYYKKALESYTNLFGANNSHVAEILKDFGDVYGEMGNNIESLNYYLELVLMR